MEVLFSCGGLTRGLGGRVSPGFPGGALSLQFLKNGLINNQTESDGATITKFCKIII